MLAQFKQFVNIKNALILANILLVFFLILLHNFGVLPVKGVGDFIFFAVLIFALALYRPGWAFLFFVGTIALENINLAPEAISLNVRPYQLIGGLSLLAVLVRFFAKRLNFSFPKWNWADGMIAVFAASGFLSALGAADKSLAIKQAFVAASFAALYFLVRIFLQNIDDLKKIIPFFLSSSVVVIFYGLWQNIRFLKGLSHFETMPGRPNATFAEADWLGIYLILVLSVIFALLYYLNKNDGYEKFSTHKSFLFGFLILDFTLLILTVSRSAWLGALAVIFAFLFLIFTNLKIHPRNWKWRETLKIKIPVIVCLISSITIVYFFHLTNFQLFNRIQSTGTGLQKITISCHWKLGETIYLPDEINNVNELEKYNCRHINLEEIEKEEALGNIVTEIYRKDPNVNIRADIYQKSWGQIKKHPLLGIGWGNIGNILGQDARGMSFNASNILLEVWLGAGFLGITSFVLFLLFGIIKTIRVFLQENSETKTAGMFLLLGFVVILVPNMFNAGILLGIVWLFFGLTNNK